MSHFSVLVVTDRVPTDEVLTEVMQPYHEFECTGTDDQYVQDIDDTDEVRAEFEGRDDKAESFVKWYKGWYGREVVSDSSRVNTKGKHKHGYCIVDKDGNLVKSVRRTNPNRKWDYWRVGGRYRAKLQAKAGAVSGVSTEPSWEWQYDKEPAPEGLDICKREDLDLDAMKRDRVEQRRKWLLDTLTDVVSTADDYLTGYRAEQVYKKVWMEMDEPRPRGNEYAEACRTWLEANGYSPRDAMLAEHVGRMWDNPDIPEGVSIEQWINDAPPLTAFAVVMNGQWYEKGKMGWWACVTDEDDQWESKFNELFDMIPPDHYISILDCHI